jgi:2-dehydro-3-deoxyphosphooctonate aldolase (KDO 8-P synthase)
MTNINKSIKINNLDMSNEKPFILISGPCVIESKNHAFDMASEIKEICKELNIKFIYKSSFDKANRSSITSSRGVGIDEGLKILDFIKNELKVNIITDVHEKEHCIEVMNVVDVIQIPAFLCRQTDLLIAAAKTGKAVMVKKGQFLAPWEVSNITDKLEAEGCKRIILCERGTSFGYNNLVSDMRSIPIMQKTGWPVIFDATHSVQQPGGLGKSSGGKREFVPCLAQASIAVGVSGVFIETHDNPDNAPSDGPNMLKINNLKNLLVKLKQIDKIAKEL